MMKPKYPQIGERLQALRHERHLKQKDCLKPLGDITIQMLSNWENGYVFPTYTYLIKISNFYKISLDYLLLGKNRDLDTPKIETYKDAVKFICALVDKGLFDFTTRAIVPLKSNPTIHLTSNNENICKFYRDYHLLNTATPVLSKENYNKALDELFEKYNIAIQEKDIVNNEDKFKGLGI